MIVLCDPQQLSQVVQPEIKTFLQQRFHDICNPEPYAPNERGFFILVEAGDTSEQIELSTGYSLLKNLFNGTVYGDSDFSPDFEYLEDHGSFCEAVTVISFKKYLSDQNGSRTDFCDRQQWVWSLPWARMLLLACFISGPKVRPKKLSPPWGLHCWCW